MPPKVPKPKIPDIPWAEDEDQLVWAFLTECEKDINYKVLFGKKETTEVGCFVMAVFRLLKRPRTQVETRKRQCLSGLPKSSSQSSLLSTELRLLTG